MKIFIITFLTFFAIYSNAQVQSGDELQRLFDQKKFDEIIDYIPGKNEKLSANDLYYKGMAYYMKSEDDNANRYFDLAIEKESGSGNVFFYKGMILLYADKFEDTLSYFNKAISLSPTESDFYVGKGEAFSAIKNTDSAQVYFEKATNIPNCKPRPFVMLAQIHQKKNDNEWASMYYKTALNKLNSDAEIYQDTAYNLGLTQQMAGKITDAKFTFEKYLSLYPTDFQAVAKMIQVHYSLEEFDKASSLKKQLYAAHKAKKLSSDMEQQFCFDQFIWNGKRVLAFEKFAEPEDILFAKHHFYITNDQNEIDYQIDSESSSAIRLTNSKNKYVLCLIKNQTHKTYWQYVLMMTINTPP